MVRLGFLGTGWIGRNRMEAMLATGEGKAVAICDPDAAMAKGARDLAPDAALVGSLEELLACEPDGTPHLVTRTLGSQRDVGIVVLPSFFDGLDFTPAAD